MRPRMVLAFDVFVVIDAFIRRVGCIYTESKSISTNRAVFYQRTTEFWDIWYHLYLLVNPYYFLLYYQDTNRGIELRSRKFLSTEI